MVFYCYFFFLQEGFLASLVFGCFLLNLFVFLWHHHLRHKPLSTERLKPASPFRGEKVLFHRERKGPGVMKPYGAEVWEELNFLITDMLRC